MSANDRSPDNTDSEVGQCPGWLLSARALLGIACIGAGYLAWVSITNGPLAGCGAGSGCDKVLQSRWAYWLSLPVSLPAVLVYAALLGATVLVRKRTSPDDERGAWAAMIVLSVVVAGAALWFIGLQVLVLRAFCQFCMLAHGCGLASALLCLWHIPFATDPATPMWSAAPHKRGIPRRALWTLVLIGFCGVAVLAAGQLLTQRQRNVVKLLPGRAGATTTGPAGDRSAGSTGSTAKATGGRSANGLPSPDARLVAPGLLSLYHDQFLLQLGELPMVGTPGASNVIVYLFDYTCTHCRLLHNILAAAQPRFGNRLGVVSLPMPMSTNCNPLIPSHFDSSPNACEYANLGLALWRANREAHRQFDEWFFAQEKPASVEDARAYAVKLVGADELDQALADPWVRQQILIDCQIHFANWEATGRPGMPQLVLGEAVSIGPLNSVEHLMALLQRYLGLHADRDAF